MAAYLIRRIGISVLMLLALSAGVFMIVRLVPGDTVTAMLGTQYTESQAAALRQEMGLDQHLIVQYSQWLGDAVRGDLGQTRTGQPVADQLAGALPVTLQLMALALGLAMIVGVPLGAIAAVKRNGLIDQAAGVMGLLGLSVPGFWLGTLMILLFALVLRWLPSGGFVPMGDDPAANLKHMIMPGVALGLAVTAVVMRMTRASVLEVLPSMYVTVARAKGLAPRRVLFRHALRNAMIPVLTIVGIQAGYLLGGSVVIEEVFTLNGVGRLILRAIGERDYPLLQGAIMLVGTGFILINLLVDITYGLIDPRVRAGSRSHA